MVFEPRYKTKVTSTEKSEIRARYMRMYASTQGQSKNCGENNRRSKTNKRDHAVSEGR